MKNSHHRNRHIRKKSIKEAEKAGYAQEEKAGWNEKEKSRYFTSEKQVNINRGKAGSQKGHCQTSPKETGWKTEPDSIHKEGKHWIQTTIKQTKSKAQQLKAKIDKHYPRRKK
jgi:hypothetical protein